MLPHIFPLLSFLTLSGAMETGIVGGKEVKKHSRPYLVSVQQHGSHKCGGILIRKDFVLTAAHFVLGAHNIQKREKSQQRIKVIKNIWHPKYKKYTDEGDWRNLSVDIMLLKLKSNAKLDKFVKALALPSKNNKPPVNVKCTIAGWGMRNPGGKTSDVLYETSVLLLPPCNLTLRYTIPLPVTIAIGDSGGPLVCSAKPQGLAIYTYPDKCNEPDYPQVSLNITPFLDWIASVINKKM
uniref:trypsin n=1 Tax=Electrophorus electricus TaxID=8005 RepID=A0A4W4GWD6_ELEEL